MSNDTTRWWLYVLKLEQGKWYVGITSQIPEKRFQEHLHGRKSYWTEKYPPIEIADKKFLGDLNKQEAELYEKRVTRAYMQEKGVNNVRGGDLTDKSDYVMRFGYIWDKYGWETLTIVILEFFLIVYLLIDKFFFR